MGRRGCRGEAAPSDWQERVRERARAEGKPEPESFEVDIAPNMMTKRAKYLLEDVMQVMLDVEDQFLTLDEVVLRGCAAWLKGELDRVQNSQSIPSIRLLSLLFDAQRALEAEAVQTRNIYQAARRRPSEQSKSTSRLEWAITGEPDDEEWLWDGTSATQFVIRRIGEGKWKLMENTHTVVYGDSKKFCMEVAQELWNRDREDLGLRWRESEFLDGYWRLYYGRSWQPVTIVKYERHAYMVQVQGERFVVRGNEVDARKRAEAEWRNRGLLRVEPVDE